MFRRSYILKYQDTDNYFRIDYKSKILNTDKTDDADKNGLKIVLMG